MAAVPVLLLTLAVRGLGPRRRQFTRMLWLTRAGRRLPWADESAIRQSVRSIRWAARGVPARIACLEESAAANLLLALSGRRGRWTQGVAVDPLRFHAWLADHEGNPIEEPADTAHYTPINQ
ncbi:lasso peptide biosynthesis B2 protein [Jiangella mangrovi]|uniref:lasso peptide biosynthesis B2 protein n=1 Tax=Jiangella mangrovi TaxID=1524084 RepID=UPI003CCD6FA9